jgi:hypothetical protein
MLLIALLAVYAVGYVITIPITFRAVWNDFLPDITTFDAGMVVLVSLFLPLFWPLLAFVQVSGKIVKHFA